jgi:ABC-type uncharacterized transport system substrate-binding protein
VRRRQFITLLSGAAAAWPLAARAQPDRVPRVGVLVAWGEDDREAKANLSEFTHGLQQLGWIDGRNIRMEIRWASGSVERMRTFAKELVYMQPAVILSVTTSPTTILQQETRTIPIVFVIVSDPVGTGVVASLAKPGANLTGFVYAEGEIGGKWLQLLKEIAPGVKRAAIMFNPNTAPGGGSYHLPSFDTAARSLNVEPITAAVHSDAEIEASIASLGREPGGGLVVMAVEAGLVKSYNQPGGNVTGVAILSNLMEPKRLGLLHELAWITAYHEDDWDRGGGAHCCEGDRFSADRGQNRYPAAYEASQLAPANDHTGRSPSGTRSPHFDFP